MGLVKSIYTTPGVMSVAFVQACAGHHWRCEEDGHANGTTRTHSAGPEP
jgi:hypothetical protein